MKLLTYTGNLQIVDMCSCGKVWNNASVHVREATVKDVWEWLRSKGYDHYNTLADIECDI